MKVCETCGKILNDSTEEFRVNGVLQCENCAYPNKQKRSEENNAKFAKASKFNNSWSAVLKTIGTINIIAGIIASLIFGLSVSKLVYGSTGALLAFGIIILGIILSVVSSSLLMSFAELGENVAVIRKIEENRYDD